MTDHLPIQENKDIQSADAKMISKLHNLPEIAKKEVLVTMEMYSGPIPHPDI